MITPEQYVHMKDQGAVTMTKGTYTPGDPLPDMVNAEPTLGGIEPTESPIDFVYMTYSVYDPTTGAFIEERQEVVYITNLEVQSAEMQSTIDDWTSRKSDNDVQLDDALAVLGS